MRCGTHLPYDLLRCRQRWGGALHCVLCHRMPCQRTPGRLSAHAAVRPAGHGSWWAVTPSRARFPCPAGRMTRWNPSRRSGEARTRPFVRRSGALAHRSGWSALPRLSVRLIEWLNRLIPHLWVSGIFIPDSSPGALIEILHWISQGVLPPSIHALSQRYRSRWVHASTPSGYSPRATG